MCPAGTPAGIVTYEAGACRPLPLAEVDDLLAKVEPGGGSIYSPAREMMPGMYSGSCTGPDGHIWEFMWMDPAGVG